MVHLRSHYCTILEWLVNWSVANENGKQLQETAHEGARPFNKAELERMDRAGTCVACHAADPKVWRKAKGKATAPTDELHRKAIETILKKGAGK